MEKVYKGIMGYKAVDGKHDYTHCILTVDEYEQLIQERDNARAETKQIISQANQEIKECSEKANQCIARVKKNAEEHVQAISSDLKNAKDEIDRLNDLNENLLRISKEKANAKRGLKPKKEHGGYVVLFSQEYDFRYGKQIYSVWKTVLQTPHDASISLKTIKPLVEDSLKNTFGISLGINMMAYEFEEEYFTSKDNTIFEQNYKANFRSGFWEVEYLHTRPIKVPVDMRTNKKT